MKVSAERASALLQDNPPTIAASFRQLSDLFLLSEGGYQPVERFLPGNEVSHVCENMHLTTGEPWSIPVIFPVSEEQANALKDAERVILTDGGKAAGVLRIEEVFKIDKSHYSKHIFRTEDPAHPGVQWLAEAGDYSLAGEVETFPDWQFDIPGGLPFSPGEVRAKIAELGWKKVIGFQTRNPIHRAHEFVTKIALETADGLVIVWEPGQNSALDSRTIAEGRDVGNVLVQRKGRDGELQDVVYRIDFAFAFFAFRPDSDIVVR